MKHTNFYALVQSVQNLEIKELRKAVKAHGGIYEWQEDEEKPIVAINPNSPDPHPFDVKITKVYLLNNWLCVEGADNQDSSPVEFLITDISVGHISFIIDYIPKTDVICDVTTNSSTNNEVYILEEFPNMTLEQIKNEYHNSEVCMTELLASISAQGLNLEEAFDLYIAARKWADGDHFSCHRDVDDIEELGEPSNKYNYSQLILSRFKNLEELKSRVEKIGLNVLSIVHEELEHLDDPGTNFKQPDLSLLVDLDPGENGDYAHVSLYYYKDRQGNIVITETAFRWE